MAIGMGKASAPRLLACDRISPDPAILSRGLPNPPLMLPGLCLARVFGTEMPIMPRRDSRSRVLTELPRVFAAVPTPGVFRERSSATDRPVIVRRRPTLARGGKSPAKAPAASRPFPPRPDMPGSREPDVGCLRPLRAGTAPP